MEKKLLLAGDIGGTKTNLALYDLHAWSPNPIAEERFISKEFSTFEEMVSTFLQRFPDKPVVACFGVAGPVHDGLVSITKLSWKLSESILENQLNIRKVYLINDLVATAHSLQVLPSADYLVINKGISDTENNMAIVAPGTGLGEAIVLYRENQISVNASEGGHALFAPANQLQTRMLSYLQNSVPQITYDTICSGNGIYLIYNYLKANSVIPEPDWFRDLLGGAGDPAALIVEYACKRNDTTPAITTKTLEIFVEILASECTNLALKVLAGGGVILAGGIPPRLVPFLIDGKFMQQFQLRPPFNSYLANMPVKLIINPKAALIGAAYYGYTRSTEL